MEKLQHRPTIAVWRDRGLVRQRRHALRMETIWTKLAPLDPWETSVPFNAYSFAETDSLTLS